MTLPSVCLLLLVALTPVSTRAAAVDTNTRREFEPPASAAEWRARARNIQMQALVSCGLYPMGERPKPVFRVFDRAERDGYTIEKVWIETYPGFYLGGNLYRPLNQGKGPFPAILNPHGHWPDGRLADKPDGSIPARCIHYARHGMIAFSYDLVGYNDTRFADVPTNRLYEAHRTFGTNAVDSLWNISLMGLQTWNSIRALDFLEALPDVDRKRLACTGESGGGTQTFMLGAVDSRLRAQAPVVMVSHIMQGGCVCENAHGLRVDFFNVDIAAAVAPRPQFVVAATGDWTRHTLEVEGPAIASIYKLLGAPENFGCARFDYGHNYNRTSREAVYAFMGKHLLKKPDPGMSTEAPYQVDPDLRVFPAELPKGAVTRQQLAEFLRRDRNSAWEATVPRRPAALKGYAKTWLPAWERTLQLDTSARPKFQPTPAGEHTLDLTIEGRTPIRARQWSPPNAAKGVALVSVAEPGQQQPASEISRLLLKAGMIVLECSRLVHERPEMFTNFFTTYNRTPMQLQANQWLSVARAIRELHPRQKLVFVGSAADGPTPMLLAPAFDALAVDADGVNPLNEQGLLDHRLYAPGLLAMGGYEGALLTAAPQSLLIHNARAQWDLPHLRALSPKARIVDARMGESDVASQILMWTTKNP